MDIAHSDTLKLDARVIGDRIDSRCRMIVEEIETSHACKISLKGLVQKRLV